jgi:undecaprenyl diphosphate synthase
MPTPTTPLHLAIIPDGNRRWAKLRNLLPWDGHRQAVEGFRTIIDWCRADPRVGTLTLWCFSTENWKRDPKEVAELMRLFEEFLDREGPHLVRDDIRLVHAGRQDRLPQTLREKLQARCAESAACTGLTLQLALDYGGRDELVRTAAKLAAAGEEVTETSFQVHLDQPTVPDIDLVIRTSGEQRSSGFFPWQTAYAEWFYLDLHFPSLTTNDLAQVLDDFERRQRRFGK